MRAVSSLDIENFFGSFQDIDPRASGVLRPDDIPSSISVAVELLDAKLNPNRFVKFFFPKLVLTAKLLKFITKANNKFILDLFASIYFVENVCYKRNIISTLYINTKLGSI